MPLCCAAHGMLALSLSLFGIACWLAELGASCYLASLCGDEEEEEGAVHC